MTVLQPTSDPGGGYVGGSGGYVNPLTGSTTAANSDALQGHPAIYFQVNLGFTYVAKPTITGSRGGNVALASLLTALVSYNILTDSTTV